MADEDLNEYIVFMHGDARDRARAADAGRWAAYLASLRASGRFDGGSTIGSGESFQTGRPARPSASEPTGFIRVRAESLEDARRLLAGNPVYEAGGTVEIRELSRD
jgi:hypothetical protein